MRRGPTELRQYLDDVQALPLRGYVPYTDGRALYKPSCLGHMERSEPDDDINYSVR